MTYILADTQKKGKQWAKWYLPLEEKFRVLSTQHQIAGLWIKRDDYVYITTDTPFLLSNLVPALSGCRVMSCNKWIIQSRIEKYD